MVRTLRCKSAQSIFGSPSRRIERKNLYKTTELLYFNLGSAHEEIHTAITVLRNAVAARNLYSDRKMNQLPAGIFTSLILSIPFWLFVIWIVIGR